MQYEGEVWWPGQSADDLLLGLSLVILVSGECAGMETGRLSASPSFPEANNITFQIVGF